MVRIHQRAPTKPNLPNVTEIEARGVSCLIRLGRALVVQALSSRARWSLQPIVVAHCALPVSNPRRLRLPLCAARSRRGIPYVSPTGPFRRLLSASCCNRSRLSTGECRRVRQSHRSHRSHQRHYHQSPRHPAPSAGVVFERTPAGNVSVQEVEVYCESCPDGPGIVLTDSDGVYSFGEVAQRPHPFVGGETRIQAWRNRTRWVPVVLAGWAGWMSQSEARRDSTSNWFGSSVHLLLPTPRSLRRIDVVGDFWFAAA